jgi:hypothetical protein
VKTSPAGVSSVFWLPGRSNDEDFAERGTRLCRIWEVEADTVMPLLPMQNTVRQVTACCRTREGALEKLEEREGALERKRKGSRERERETESFIIVGISITGSRASSAHGLRITILLVCSTG